jgi:hypothetical protein
MGPYLGSFEYEVKIFRPFVEWIKMAIKPDKLFVSSHFNRYFIYNNIIDEECFIPVYKHLSRDEIGQIEHRHKSVNQKDFSILTRSLKTSIIKKYNYNKNDVDILNLGYSRNAINDISYKKFFSTINIDNIPDELKNLYIFIPNGDEKKSTNIYKYLKGINNNFVVVGDLCSSLSKYNIILEFIDYFENGWKYIVGAITYSKIVVCELSYWTMLCNLQKSNILSWGETPSLYREKCGIYNFDNQKAVILPNINLKSNLINKMFRELIS